MNFSICITLAGLKIITDRQVQDDAAIGARVPIGLDLTLNDVPVQFFLDVSADVEVLPDPVQDLWLGLGLGGRYFF